ncbi:MAG: phage portal protein [Pseudomonadota bacterium]|nr:phage portal protein [Pseudomonadota bacterium]
MGLLTRIKSWLPLPFASQLWTPSWLASAGLNPAAYDPANKDPTPAESMTLGSVYRACTLLSDSLAAPELRVVRREAGGGSQRVTGTDAARCIESWDYGDKELFLLDALVSGNGFARIVRNGRGAPEALDAIPAWRVGLVREESTNRIWYRISEDQSLGLPEETLPVADVLHLRFRVHGRHKMLGISPLATCAPSLGFVAVTQKATTTLYRNVSAPLVVVSHDKRLSEGAMERLKTAWEGKFQGPSLGRTAVAMEGMKVSTLDLGKALEMQLAEIASVSTREVARVFGVPEQLLSESSNLNYSTSVELTRAFYAHGLAPWAARFSDTLTHALLTPEARAAGQRVDVDLGALTRGQGQELADYVSKLVNSGAVTLNEARDWLGLPDVKDGDVVRIPVNTYPMQTWLDFVPGQQQASAGNGDSNE